MYGTPTIILEQLFQKYPLDFNLFRSLDSWCDYFCLECLAYLKSATRLGVQWTSGIMLLRCFLITFFLFLFWQLYDPTRKWERYTIHGDWLLVKDIPGSRTLWYVSKTVEPYFVISCLGSIFELLWLTYKLRTGVFVPLLF